jgi:ABC-type glycerol-3-phosphate transport system substrate-binding protein
MFKRNIRVLLAVSMLVLVILVAGCGGSGGKRVPGLSATETVTTFFDAAKNNRMSEASLYVSSASKNDPKTVLKFMTGQSGIQEIKNANIASIKQVAQQGNYTAVIVTIQEQNSFKMSVKPVGLEKINGEWYIVDFDQIYNDAKYKVLLQLLSNI